nr:hypothetical protein I308_00010 [Cryptococcus tetragattii IND107]
MTHSDNKGRLRCSTNCMIWVSSTSAPSPLILKTK